MNAQRVFEAGTCRQGLSIGEWCTLKAAETCCGVVCGNAPISGPATVLVFTLGTLMNLGVCYGWKSEAPFNLMLQLLGTDGAVVGMLVRTTGNKFHLSAFHAPFALLALMSSIPVLVAACTVEVELFHNLSLPVLAELEGTELGKQLIEAGMAKPETPPKERPRLPPTAHSHPVTKKDLEAAEQLTRGRRLRQAMVPTGKTALLGVTATVMCALHFVFWIGAFFWIHLGFGEPAQANCLDELPLSQYGRTMAIMTGVYLVYGLFWFFCLAYGLFRPKLHTKAERWDGLQVTGKLPVLRSWRWYVEAVEPSKSGWKRSREIIRACYCLLPFAAWTGCYLTLWFLALDKFLLLGNNPWDWGQVTASVNILGGACLAARAFFEQVDGLAQGQSVKDGAQALVKLRHELNNATTDLGKIRDKEPADRVSSRPPRLPPLRLRTREKKIQNDDDSDRRYSSSSHGHSSISSSTSRSHAPGSTSRSHAPAPGRDILDHIQAEQKDFNTEWERRRGAWTHK